MKKKLALLAVGAAAGLVALAAPASAHVIVTSPGATEGGYGVLTFRVPTESATASTTKLAVQLPTDEPFASVAVKPMAGWSYAETDVKLATPITNDDGDSITSAVGVVTWTAQSAADAIKPGQFTEFELSVGPFPNASQIQFAAVQTYSDGTVVQWNQVAAPGSTTEPDHPKPTLTLTAASTTDSASTAPTAQASTIVKKSSNTGGIVLGVIALVVAALALGVAVVGNARRRA